MQKEIFDQLTTNDTPPRDIFTVFRENHPETNFLTDRPETSVTSFDIRKQVDLRSGEQATSPGSIVPYLRDRAVISEACKDVADTIDVHQMLKQHNWEGAEFILGRPLTQEEKASQLVREKQAPLADQAARELKLEELKGRIKTEKKKRRALLARWKAAREKRERDTLAAAIANIDAELKDYYAGIADLFNDEDDDDDDFGLGGLGGNDDSEQDDDDDDAGDEAALDDSVSTVVYKGQKQRKDGEEKEETGSIASTVLDRRRQKAKLADTLIIPPLDPNIDYNVTDLKARANQLRTAYPWLKTRGTGILRNLEGGKDVLRANIEDAEKAIDAARDREADAARAAREKILADVDDVLLSPSSGLPADVPLPSPQAGFGTGRIFTGLTRKKNEQDFVRWNDRFVINLKKLKDRGFFNLYYPNSGQPHNQIRAATLTPALKEIVLAYLKGEPQDTTGLSPEELKWLKMIWTMSGVTKPAPKLRIAPKLYKGKADMRERLKVLMGELLAGNDNPEVTREMTNVCDKLEAKQWLSPEEIINCRQFISGKE